MNKVKRGKVSVAFFAIVLMLGLPGVTHASTILLGSDYFQTVSGTFFTFPGIGPVQFQGGPPVGPGNTDTIVQRQADATAIPGGPPALPIPIQIESLSLKSIAPVNVGGSFFDVFVDLAGTQSKGTMTISENASSTGGTFNSFLPVNFDAMFKPVGGGTGFMIPGSTTLTGTDTQWTTIIPTSAVAVSGPVGDQAANVHGPLGAGDVDFYPVGVFSEVKPDGSGAHAVRLATIPEGSTLLLFMTGLSALGGIAYRRNPKPRPMS